jgi:hypothetical protein
MTAENGESGTGVYRTDHGRTKSLENPAIARTVEIAPV